MRAPGSRTAVGRLSGLVVIALVVAAAGGMGACGDSDSEGTAVLSVENLSDEVQGWRLRAEAFAPELDGSPTFYFSDSEQVVGSSMTSPETTLGARSYVLVVELADPSGGARSCEADLVISAGESVELTVEAESLGEPDPSQSPPVCSLAVEQSPSE